MEGIGDSASLFRKTFQPRIRATRSTNLSFTYRADHRHFTDP